MVDLFSYGDFWVVRAQNLREHVTKLSKSLIGTTLKFPGEFGVPVPKSTINELSFCFSSWGMKNVLLLLGVCTRLISRPDLPDSKIMCPLVLSGKSVLKLVF